jgi:hypothetical protein
MKAADLRRRALLVIRSCMRDFARRRRACNESHPVTGATWEDGRVSGALSLAYIAELITQAEYTRLVARTRRIALAPITRRPFRHLMAVAS